MNSPLIWLNAGASHHLPYPLIGLNLLWCLSRGRSDLTFLSSRPSYEIQTFFFFYPSIWFPHWLGSEDHARPKFCPTLVIFIFCTWFPHRLESEDHARPRFCPTLALFIFRTWFPHRLESEDHARPWFCPWAPVLNLAWAGNLLGPKIRGYFRSLRSRGTFWASQCSRCAFSRLL